MKIDELLQMTTASDASDLHLSVGNPPIIRVDGDLRPVDRPVIDEPMMNRVFDQIMTDQQRKLFKENLELDLAYQSNDGTRFRVNAYYQARGAGAAFRNIPSKIPTLEELNAPEVLKRFCDNRNGLVLVTGPTGSGKSTTLAAMVNHINSNTNQHIITIEDPIEFTHTCKKCLINQRELHRDTLSFSNALRSALREDPDIILVGEMRDLETIRLALTAAETGHLVFATLHTNSASKTIDRIIDVFPSAEQGLIRSMLSESLRGVIAQTLVKRIGGGRVAAHEILVSTAAVRNLIRENKIPQLYSTLQTGSGEGMRTMQQTVSELIAANKISSDYRSTFEMR